MMSSSYRKFIVDRIVPESVSAKSFYLVPADGGSLAPHAPGQHLPLRLTIPGQSRLVHRSYTLSDCENGQCYRLTIKKEPPPLHQPDAPGGVSSTYFNDIVRTGDAIEAKPPAGNFFLDLQQNHPVVLIAGGIGVTPLLSMMNAIARHQPNRPAWLFFSLRHGRDHVFKQHIQSLIRAHPSIRHHIFYSQPKPEDRPGVDYHHARRIDVPFLATMLPTLQMEYYICGPDGMMKSVIEGLTGAGVAKEQIRTESFGASSAASPQIPTNPPATLAPPSVACTITFQKSGKVIPWNAQAESVLQLAEQHGVEIDSGCRYGDCGTCLTPLLKGQVTYNHPTTAKPDPGTCLPCSCQPDGAIVIDA
jgi:ferredoxin-NADP reductase